MGDRVPEARYEAGAMVHVLHVSTETLLEKYP